MAFVFLKKFNGFVLRAICHYKQMPLQAAFYHRKLALGAKLRPLPQGFAWCFKFKAQIELRKGFARTIKGRDLF